MHMGCDITGNTICMCNFHAIGLPISDQFIWSKAKLCNWKLIWKASSQLDFLDLNFLTNGNISVHPSISSQNQTSNLCYKTQPNRRP